LHQKGGKGGGSYKEMIFPQFMGDGRSRVWRGSEVRKIVKFAKH